MNKIDAPVCVVDDDSSIREAIEGLLRAEGTRVETYRTAREFLTPSDAGSRQAASFWTWTCRDLSGLELQRELFRTDVHIPIIFLTGHGDIPMSVRAIKAGAFEFLTKPFDPDDLLDAIQEGLLTREYGGSRITDHSSPHSNEIVGASSAYRTLLKQIELVAPTDSTVLIQGETGTGKELIAREIHKISRRKSSRSFG